MAKKTLPQQPLLESSSEEETFDSSSEESKTLSAPVAAAMQSSDSETDTETESESELNSTVTTAASALPEKKNKLLSEETTRTSVKAKRAKVETYLVESSYFFRTIACSGVNEVCAKKRWSLVPVKMKKKLEGKLKDLKRKEMELAVMRADFVYQMAYTLFG